ncbi:AbrB family transcriptional regulator [Corynebacterium sp. sy017]|uniref:AbrB family transcriptional regulator n=1 Tax=unclassified Corynebacterium TaxID=2624378 RepID=UPI0011857CC2|nr:MULTISPECIES: AbrB family transcriptional regulator [unclassified Corynebacterium]MBP3088328.1 AbrB family transcriptional regulator [Corynebacterium sp. sy017]QDZ41781.1 AbrB family transcriptional regulator [Corynebacterium sp. sy039]TSD91649.1 AbrB family transcriptional regulator [Corynebacterium sp. SY003]
MAAKDKRIWLRWLIVVAASIVFGLLFQRLHIPAGWILAGILASGALALSTGQELTMNKQFFVFVRGFIGILAGVPLVGTPLVELTPYILPALFTTAITLGIGVIGGLLLSRAQRAISSETAILSMLAGGASMMPMLAKELGADYRYVALSQYLRLLIISISLPLITHVLSPQGASSHAVHPPLQAWWVLLIMALIAFFGDRFGRLLHLPAPTVLGPMVCTVIIGKALSIDFTPPYLVQYVAFMAIGWMCGGGLSVAALKLFAAQLPATLIFIAVLICGCAATALPLTSWLDVSYFEAYLATSPGALETVLALSSEGNAGSVVIAFQIIRVICVLLLAGYLPTLIRLILRRRSD